MAGQLFVRTIEVPEAATPALLRLADDDRAFLDLPFEEAVRVFAERRIVDPETFYSDLSGIRQRSFTASLLASEALMKRARNLLRSALERGMTVEEFTRRLQASELTLGIEPSNDGYLRTVFETNVSANYGAGRFQQINQPAVMQARPFVEYRAILDAHTRESHAALHGTVYRTDSPGWHDIAPPNGFSCRCSIITRPESWVAREKPDVYLTPPQRPDASFEGPPTTLLEV